MPLARAELASGVLIHLAEVYGFIPLGLKSRTGQGTEILYVSARCFSSSHSSV